MVTFDELEEARQSLRKKSLKFGVPSFVGSIAIFIFLALQNINSSSEDIEKAMLFLPISMFSMTPILVGFVLMTNVFAKNDEQKYKKLYKEYFVISTLKTIFEPIEYNPEKGLSRNQVLYPGLLKEGNRFSSEDYFKATYKDAAVEGSDLLIQYRTSDGVSTYFNGLWVVFDLENPLPNFQIIRKGFSGDAHNAVASAERDLDWVDENIPEEELFNKYWPEEKARAKSAKESAPPYLKLKTDDDIFNKKYKIFSQNETEANNFLKQNITEKFISLAESTQSAFMVGSVGRKLYIAIERRDFFDPRGSKSIDENSERERLRNIIKIATDIFDILAV